MKLKLEINGNDYPENFKLLKTTVTTVASLRSLAVLRFDSDRLVIISTPRVSNGVVAGHGVVARDSGELWCTIPRDVFSLYHVSAERQNNTIALECNVESLKNAVLRYDKVMTQGSASTLQLKLRQMPEWNAASANGPDSAGNSRIRVAALAVSFEELVNVYSGQGKDDAFMDATQNNTSHAVNKLISHSSKIPVRFLNAQQDERIQEPMMDYNQTMLCRLPSITDEAGGAFLNFLKRIERYTNVNHIKLQGSTSPHISHNRRDAKLRILVDELDWNLVISWNGPLELQERADIDEMAEPTSPERPRSETPLLSRISGDNNFDRIDDSEVNTLQESGPDNNSHTNGFLEQVQQAEDESSLVQEVIIRSKDLKVCSKLFAAFEEVIMAISHDYACVFHCSLSRGLRDTQTQEEKENGQIIYYISRSKALEFA
ncbi:Hus1-like protein [Nakaseomyces glabratus]